MKRPGIARWLIKALVLSLSSGAFGDVVFLSETSQGCALVCLVKQARRFLKRLKEREREKTKAIGEGKEVEMTMSQADDDGISFGRGHNIRVKKERQIKKKKKRVGCVTRKPTLMRIEYNNLIREKRERERKKRGSKCFLSFVCFMAVRALFSPSYSRSPLW